MISQTRSRREGRKILAITLRRTNFSPGLGNSPRNTSFHSTAIPISIHTRWTRSTDFTNDTLDEELRVTMILDELFLRKISSSETAFGAILMTQYDIFAPLPQASGVWDWPVR